MGKKAQDDADVTAPVRRGRRARLERGQTRVTEEGLATRAVGGRMLPLDPGAVTRLHAAVLDILGRIGLSDVPPVVAETVVGGGGRVTAGGRLLFPADLVERALEGFPRDIVLYGQHPGHELELAGARVHVGSGGAAPLILDLDTGRYRDTTLKDLYDAARLVDALDNVHFFSRSVVARDMPDPFALDINTAFASLAGTAKHVMTSVSSAEHVASIAELCFDIAGSPSRFHERPFLSLNVNHVAPPLRFDESACEVLAEAARLGIPVHVNTFGQLGASSPVTIAGAAAQTVAETLAGMIYVWLVNPAAKAIFGPRPMVTDLRSGAMTGGGGEQALLTAVAVQMGRFYGLSNSTIAGATDSKVPDAQSGFEKCLSITTAAQTGANLITQACGTLASLMACSFDSYVIDNDMLGAILRSTTPVEVSDDTLAPGIIEEVVLGEGHYLGHAETLKRMKSDFLYPRVADRRSPGDWESAGAHDIRHRARLHAREILQRHYPSHLGRAARETIRGKFDIRLPESSMGGS